MLKRALNREFTVGNGFWQDAQAAIHSMLKRALNPIEVLQRSGFTGGSNPLDAQAGIESLSRRAVTDSHFTQQST